MSPRLNCSTVGRGGHVRPTLKADKLAETLLTYPAIGQR